MESALSIESLRVNYGPLKALTGVTFALEPGRVCGVVGMNGSGTSTLIKAIVGTVRSSGDIAVYGESARAARRDGLIGYVPQNEGVDWDFPLTVACDGQGAPAPTTSRPSIAHWTWSAYPTCATDRSAPCRAVNAKGCSSPAP